MTWRLKIAAKILLSRLPLSYWAWKSIGIFRHGKMDSASYALKIFAIHFMEYQKRNGLSKCDTYLELGCGDSIGSAIIAKARGFKKVYLVDVGDFASKDIRVYQELVMLLRDAGLSPPRIELHHSFDDILQMCNASYLINGLQDLYLIPDDEVDFMYSHSVLEHIRKNELKNVIRELYRIMRPGGFGSHTIDYQDHLSKGLNNLRFSERLWESNFFYKSGFYTNRVPAVDMHRFFMEAKFQIAGELFGVWDTLPIPRKVMSKEFRGYSERDLLNRTSSIFLKKESNRS